MKDIAHKKNQNFILFWLGLLTGALLIVALYSVGGSEDLLGKVRGRSYQVPTYTPSYNAPAYNYGNPANLFQPNITPVNAYQLQGGGAYSVPDNDGYNAGYNSVLHVAPTTSGASLRSRVTAPSINRYGVSTPNYGAAAQFSPVNTYGVPDNDSYSAY